MGRTFHSRFKTPFTVIETSTLSISKQSNSAELIRRTKLIVWDEAPMNGRYLLEAFDQRVCDITSIYKPFGGEIILLAGYFRQILPVVKHGSRSQVIDSVMNKSPLWNHFERFRLSDNMRVLRSNFGYDQHYS